MMPSVQKARCVHQIIYACAAPLETEPLTYSTTSLLWWRRFHASHLMYIKTTLNAALAVALDKKHGVLQYIHVLLWCIVYCHIACKPQYVFIVVVYYAQIRFSGIL